MVWQRYICLGGISMAIYDTIQFMFSGISLTIGLYITTGILAFTFGILASVAKTMAGKRGLIYDLYTCFFRGTPLMLQLFFIYFGLPVIGLKFSAFQSALIAFSLNYGAYIAEIIRGGIESVEKGQYEAAKALGMGSWLTMKSIILPQAFKRVLPSLCNESITLIKDTALVAAIGLGDLLRAAKQIVTRDITVVPFVLAALFYLLFTTLIVWGFKRIALKMSYYEL